MKQLIIQPKQQYGQEVLIPICETASLLCQVAGTKTMTRQTLKLVKELGYEIKIHQPVKTLEDILK